ncbi:MAG: ATPase [Actinobacteria bacterium]|nr:MAG: ATPase [Actinomycetota bacterium]
MSTTPTSASRDDRRDLADDRRDHPSLGLTPLSRVRLDELLQEMLDRVSEVIASRERLRALLDAVVGISTSLDLRSTLQRIVRAATELAHARYGALGVVGPDRMLREFVTHGLSPQRRARLADPPHGRGILGLLLEDPRPLRLPDLTKHPKAYGFPPNHPPMRSFLGVPILIRDRVFGNLYLAEKRGGGEFTEDDEEIVVALAAAAGVAIDNAQLYEVTQRRERWMAASLEITKALLGEVRRTDALSLVARHAREVADAELVLVLLYDEEAGHFVVDVVQAAAGQLAPPVGTTVIAAETTFAASVTSRQQMVIDNLATAAPWPVPMPDSPAIVSPLAAGDTLHGVLVVAGTERGDDEARLLAAFAGQAALAMERVRAQEERALLAVLEDRERIARDLHDVVIQRLFATGLNLQSTVPLIGRADVGQRINEAVDELDSTIRDIRRTIFELRTPMSAALRTEIRDAVDSAAASLGFRPTLELFGPIDSAVPDEIRPDMLAVLREALSNVVRHARASQLTVTVRADDGHLTLTVADNGVGTNPEAARGGLINMRERAAAHGGEFAILPGEPSGTVLRWRVPLSGPDAAET